MAAGQGYIEFATGDVLTAASANGYLASQVVMVFASSAARTSAIASPQEGMISYLKDTNATQYYSGSAWVTIGGSASPLTTKGDLYTYSTADARLAVGTNGQYLSADSAESTGLKWITPAAASSGLTLIQRSTVTAAADTGTTFDGVFSSTYGAYLVIMESVVGSTGNADLLVQGMYSGSTQSADYQGAAFGYSESGSLITALTATGSTSAKLGKVYTSNNSYSMIVTGVGVAGNRLRLDTSGWTAQNGGGYKGYMSALQDRTYTGLKISLSTGNITTTTAVYGLASA